MRTLWVVGMVSGLAWGCSSSGKGSSSASATTTGPGSVSSSSGSTNGGSSVGIGSASTSSGTHGSSTSGGSSSGSATSGSSGGSSGGGTATFAAFCPQFNTALCAHLQACGLLDPAFSCTNVDFGFLPSCDAGGYFQYDSVAASACLAGLSGTSCPLASPVPLQTDGGSSCYQVLSPTVALGQPCLDTSREPTCLPNSDGGRVACLTAPGTCGGVCAAAAGLGQPCNQGVPCGDGYCDPTQGDVCVAYAAMGANCSDGELCDPSTSYCGLPPDGGSPTQYCLPSAAPGASCAPGGCSPGYFCGETDAGQTDGGPTCLAAGASGAACDGQDVGACLPGLICFAGTCATQGAPNGSPCGFGGGAFQSCLAGYCASPDGGSLAVGTCTAPGAAGAACSPTVAGNCAVGLACVGGQCTGPAATGSACGPELGCADGYCSSPDGGVCLAFGAMGASCTPTALCAAPLVCVTGTCSKAPSAGQACGEPSPGGSLSTGCIEGDYCNGTDCELLGQVGASCSPAAQVPVPTCFESYCAASGHCSALLPPGSPCQPGVASCSGGFAVGHAPDGGVVGFDPSCVPVADGGSVCAVRCD